MSTLFLFLIFSLFYFASAWLKDPKYCYEGWPRDKLFGKSLLILGDSQGKRLMKEMERLAVEFAHQTSTNILELMKLQKNRCSLCTYLGADCVSKKNWQRPPSSDIGPRVFGLKNSRCSDCRGCEAVKYTIKFRKEGDVKGSGESFLIEFIPVEFAKDYTIQTPGKLTTQENVVEYLKPSPPDYIIFNTGLHDIAISSLEQYKTNLKFYVDLLSTLNNTKLIWVGTGLVDESHVHYRYKHVYKNITGYNTIANEVMSTFSNDDIEIIDPVPDVVVGREYNKGTYYLDAHHFRQNSSFYSSILVRAMYSICAIAPD